MKIRYGAVLALLVVLTGCGTPTTVVSSNPILPPLANNQAERLEMVGALSEGVDVSLKKEDIPAATKLNDHIKIVSNKPSPEAIRKVMGSLANDEVAKDLEKRINELAEEKMAIEKRTLQLVDTLTNDLAAAKNAKKVAEDELSALKNPFTAISYGIKTLVKRFLWTITGLGIVFLLLRTFAASNPVIGAIFDVFQHIVAYVIKAISALFPKAVKLGSRAFQKRDETAKVIIDAIEQLPDAATIDDLKQKILEDSDVTHRDEIDQIRRELGW